MSEYDRLKAQKDAYVARDQAKCHDAAVEEVAQFVETHYCVINPLDPTRSTYITHERPKHPCSPLAMAIRGMKVLPQPTDGKT